MPLNVIVRCAVRDWMGLKWKHALWLLMACLFVGAWWILLGTLCQAPSAPVAATGNVIQYNCHGSVVFITPFQNRLLHWLIPALFVVGYFALLLIRRRNRASLNLGVGHH